VNEKSNEETTDQDSGENKNTAEITKARAEREAIEAKEKAKEEAKKAKQEQQATERAERETQQKAKARAEKEAAEAKEKAKEEARRAKQEKRAAERAEREAQQKAKARAGREGGEEMVTEEKTDEKLYSEVVKIVIERPVEIEQLKKLTALVQEIPELRLLLTGGSAEEGNKIVVSAEQPLPLEKILSEMPLVAGVTKKGKDILVTLKPM